MRRLIAVVSLAGALLLGGVPDVNASTRYCYQPSSYLKVCKIKTGKRVRICTTAYLGDSSVTKCRRVRR